jgi:hypothetical protein
MNLTSPELKLIVAMQRQERHWRWWRRLLFLLAMGSVVGAGLWAYILWSCLSPSNDAAKAALGIAVVSFMFAGQLFMALLLFGMMFRWHYFNRARRLVLKLLDAQEEQSVEVK